MTKDLVVTPIIDEEELESQPQRQIRRKRMEREEQQQSKIKGKGLALDDESMDDVAFKDAELTVKRHYNYNRMDDIHSHIDEAINQFNVIEQTTRYNKWKKYEYRKKVIKLASKLNN